MFLQQKHAKWYLLAVLTLLLAGRFLWIVINKSMVKTPAPAAMVTPSDTIAADPIPAPTGAQWLADSTHAYLLGDSKLTPAAGFPRQRELTMQGDAFFDVPAGRTPLIIHSPLLKLVVTGPAAFRLMAPAKKEWAEVDVIHGNIIVSKTYHSDFPAPDTLANGNMEMLNRDIDLMEKETFDTSALKAWRERQQ